MIYTMSKDNECIRGDTHYNLRYMFNEAAFTTAEIRKWMRMAKATTEAESPCLSRQIGVVIADQHTDSLVSSGHNSPPDETPNCDNADYLCNVVWPQLEHHERLKILEEMPDLEKSICHNQAAEFANHYAGCGQCPRRIVGAQSGKRLELCTCAHGETNAIVKAHRSVAGCWMFCWCSVPCVECTKLIINSRIRVVVALDQVDPAKDYSPFSSRWLFNHSNTDLILISEELLEKNQ